MAFKPSDTDKTQRMVGRLPSAGLFHHSEGLDNQSLEELDHAVDFGSGVGVPHGLEVSGRAILPMGWVLPVPLQTMTSITSNETMDRSEVVGRLPSAGLFHRSKVHPTVLMPDPPSVGTEAVGAGDHA